MAKNGRHFIKGRMNKSVDERLIPNGEYVDALNVRTGATEESEIGAVENTLGNLKLTTLSYDGIPLSPSAVCIGATAESETNRIFWFVHDPDWNTLGNNPLDLVVSYDTTDGSISYHVISVSVLNFDPNYFITGVNILDDFLLWTDNLNQPRCINVKRSYGKPAKIIINYVDTITDEDLLVIKRPPIGSPSIKNLTSGSGNRYLSEKFICFAYRYRYADGEYSATSQFSEPAFVPGAFNVDLVTGLNTGMINSINSCEITYNSGSRLVVGIDILFKDMESGTINVIDKLDKSNLGLVDNTDYKYVFNNSKSLTVLPIQEISRLYDNVPIKAKAQTIMDNRLMYGNYVEGFDLVDSSGYKLRSEFDISLISTEIDEESISSRLDDATYTIDTPKTVTDGIVYFDLSGLSLIKGAGVSFEVVLSHDSFTTSGIPNPTATNNGIIFSLTYILPRDYTSVYDLATSAEFLETIGTAANIQTVANSCSGFTETDEYNCAFDFSLNALDKSSSGINFSSEPIRVLSSTSSNEIGFQFPAMRYDDGGSNYAYEYLAPTSVNAVYRPIAIATSLHSSMGYEVGIIYMDEFGRSTTVITSPDNNVFVGAEGSVTRNRIRVTIPSQQRPPAFASHYKFAIKPEKETYNTIYSAAFFEVDAFCWVKLEGENIRKVEEGDKLIVKADTSGPLNRYVEVSVLEKSVKTAGFIPSATEGTYMKIPSNDFSVSGQSRQRIYYGQKTDSVQGDDWPVVRYEVQVEDPNATSATDPWIDYSIPEGATISISVNADREGRGCSWSCNTKSGVSNITATAKRDYSDFKSWFDSEGIASLISSALDSSSFCGGSPVVIDYDPTVISMSSLGAGCDDIKSVLPQGDNESIFLRFVDDDDCPTRASKRYLCAIGMRACYRKKESVVRLNIVVYRDSFADLIFETEPKDALPDVWYESSDSYEISGGNHLGNVQDQNVSTGVPAIIDTAFFNCYSFGNGAESYKIQDSIIGKSMLLGNRVTSVAAQEYGQAHRYADITYSGIYNDETNVNKLNEFNASLLNFKDLEDSFGPVQVLDGMDTNILVLQEDMISYVLVNKNLLSDAVGGGAVTSVPEVLGTQIARKEEYGISNNPESYAKYGALRWFTDEKRSAVIMLTGGGVPNESLRDITGLMDSWFRDTFISNSGTFKLGGYDPYNDEYVLHISDKVIPVEDECEPCGFTKGVTVDESTSYSDCIDLGETVGDSYVDYNIVSTTGSVNITVNYNGTNYSSGPVSTSGSLNFPKGVVGITSADITVSAVSGETNIILTVRCPEAQEINIIQVTLSSSAVFNQKIHNQYRWTDGSFISPLHSTQVQMALGTTAYVVSQFEWFSGPQGGGYIPADGAVVSMISKKIVQDGDDLIFDASRDGFRYLRSNTLYSNTPGGIAALLAASSAATPITGSDPEFKASFTMPSTNDHYLYLIYDYVRDYQITLCQSLTDDEDACFGCQGTELIEVTQCREDGVVETRVVPRAFGVNLGEFVKLLAFDPECVFEVTALDVGGVATAEISGVAFVESCDDVCGYYEVSNPTAGSLNIAFVDCDDIAQTFTLISGQTTSYCIKSLSSIDAGLTITLTSCDCP
jgi:hypothetical protein